MKDDRVRQLRCGGTILYQNFTAEEGKALPQYFVMKGLLYRLHSKVEL